MEELEAIVIGGSAGALDALLTIVPGLPEGLSCPIVIVLHLAPTLPSHVPEILSRISSRMVHEAQDKLPLRPREIYVAAPNYHLLIERDRSLSLSMDDAVHHSRPSIDVLFGSAADAYGPGVAGVLLSGANHDGAEGLCQIQRAGGMAIVQNPETASSPMMPDSAIRRVGAFTHVVGLSEMAGFFARFVGGAARVGGLRG